MIFKIDDNFIKETEAITKTYNKGDVVINEGIISPYFLYLINGEISVFNYTQEGKEFLQHKVQENHFFGEPAILLDLPFPGTVEVTQGSAQILKIGREKFLEHMRNNPERMLEFCQSIAAKAVQKSCTLKNLVFLNPEDRILKQLQEYKKERRVEDKEITILMTRREISSRTGLRVETVIRTVKNMEKRGKLKIKAGKIIF